MMEAADTLLLPVKADLSFILLDHYSIIGVIPQASIYDQSKKAAHAAKAHADINS